MKQLQKSRGVVCRIFVANLLAAKNMLLMCGTTSRIRGAVLVSKGEFDSFVISFVIFFFTEGKHLSVIREKKELSGSSTSLNSIGKQNKLLSRMQS